MKAVKLVKPFALEMCNLPIPEPGPGQVLLKNEYLGVCTSDMQIYHGKHAYAAMPVTMGHEESGIVEKVGANVTDWKPGDRVVLQPQLFCGTCYPCRTGHFNVCENLKVIGVHTDGCACEYVAVPQWNLHRVPVGLDLRRAALAEPLAVGFGVVRRICEVSDIKGKRVCIVGAGTIGNFVAQACKAMGAEQVMVTDIQQMKLDVAARCGIDYAVNTNDTSLSSAIVNCFGPDKADIIVDSAASPFGFQSIWEASRKQSVIVISGNYKEPVSFDVTQLQRREITLLGHMMYLREEFDQALTFLANGVIQTDEIITQDWTLDTYANAFEYVDKNPEKVIKMMVKIGL